MFFQKATSDFMRKYYLRNHPWENQDFWCLSYRLDLNILDHIYTWFHWYNSHVHYTFLHIGDQYRHYQWPRLLVENQQGKILGTIWNAQIWKRGTNISKVNQPINLFSKEPHNEQCEIIIHHIEEVENTIHHFKNTQSIPHPVFCLKIPGHCQ